MFIPLEHQKQVINRIRNQRGIVLYWTLGSGKTCASIIASDILIDQPVYRKIYVLTPGSLRQNFISEYCEVCGKSEEYLRKYRFLTYNSNNIASKISAKKLSNSIVIVDEAHNIVNGRRNESRQFVAVYNAIRNSKNSKIILITGTPLVTSPYEIRILIEMVRPNLLPNHEKELKELINKKPKKLSKLVSPYIFYYQNKTNLKDYPKVFKPEIIKCKLTKLQDEQYIEAEIKEKRGKFVMESNILKPNYISIMHVMTRSIGNMAQVDDSMVSLKTIKKYSTKIPHIINHVTANKGKHVVYSFFKKRSGIMVISKLLRLCGINVVEFHGSLNDKERKNTLDNYNHQNNLRGERIQVILLTSAGIEGISLKGVRFLHILEPLDSKVKESQLIGRVSRFKSHNDLEKSERNVKILMYCTVVDKSNSLSSDEILTQKAQRRWKEMEPILDILRNGHI